MILEQHHEWGKHPCEYTGPAYCDASQFCYFAWQLILLCLIFFLLFMWSVREMIKLRWYAGEVSASPTAAKHWARTHIFVCMGLSALLRGICLGLLSAEDLFAVQKHNWQTWLQESVLSLSDLLLVSTDLTLILHWSRSFYKLSVSSSNLIFWAGQAIPYIGFCTVVVLGFFDPDRTLWWQV
eukprot:NODE_2278_length_1097_cov_68.784536_g2260_i0.p1 GENE.NODE_2278_length_1097_cov_68.784536_g2260_i0~~NODE_2278_length_1097_cov_68.784536_g2260_i0.p1  ORF type:complete len:182 (+),score=10.36 NODE_2278_length_1097_cov_68.784536_g2260_i0:85-630(+)